MSKKVIALIVILAVGVVYFVARWQLAEYDLALAGGEMTKLQSSVESSGEEIIAAHDEIETLELELERTGERLVNVEAELAATQASLADVTAELEDTQDRLAAMETDAYNLHDPTFDEALDFLEADRTDDHEYIEDEYVCSHFAADVNNNAEREGIRCAMVDIRFSSSSHAIIAFDTTDEGLVYFDPITDDRVRPVIGKRYWHCIEPKPGYVYEEPSFDDTILDIVVIW
jgi:hypothetical protein